MTTNPTPLTAESITLGEHLGLWAGKTLDGHQCFSHSSLKELIEAYAAQQNAELGATISQLNSDIAELQAENERLKQQLAWQPIETAPKDGSQFLVTDGDCVVMAEQPNSDGVIVHDVTTCGFCASTNWMPLPQPPKEAT